MQRHRCNEVTQRRGSQRAGLTSSEREAQSHKRRVMEGAGAVG
jgi:hypothetical protein